MPARYATDRVARLAGEHHLAASRGRHRRREP